jgi:hypothetical protein
MLNFEELTASRRFLQGFCLIHIPSLLKVQSGISFKLLPSDPPLGMKKARHLTTTATCYSSLFDSPSLSSAERIMNLQTAFARKALRRSLKEWTSEGSAGVYCTCRALPTVIKSIGDFDERIERHLSAILKQLDMQPGRFAIGEAGSALRRDQWYPPNAFHTYWTLEILCLIRQKYSVEYSRLEHPANLDLGRKRNGMLLWARQQLGYQLGLHSSTPASSMLDSDQLAWSLAILLRFDETLTVNLENRDFLKEALKCLFSTQTDGTWRHYKPLFHYKKAGNAYCYVFETFAILLQCALRAGAVPEMVRELLKPYGKNLMDLWRYADSTKIPLPKARKAFGWCSGHRTNVTAPESWATASVFSYAQSLRRLIGIWCREEALGKLNTPHTRVSSRDAAQEIVSRGKTWGIEKIPISEQLFVSFINPVLMHECNDKLEPDSQPIAEDHARSAILFGPPGTSKTTLIRLLADAIGWDYVELHASHFVAEGLTQVQKTADTIFNQLAEVDHTVVLFDEIDELVRERDIEKDAFGRFLTTSMLPKLAELWTGRKVLYFVATNHINYFDSAIVRSHRFDALILVSPPSYTAKVAELKRLLSKTYRMDSVGFDVLEEQVQRELQDLGRAKPVSHEAVLDWREQKVRPEYALAKFALLRWDELDELAYYIHIALTASTSKRLRISVEILKEALIAVADSEWRKNKSYADYLRDTQSERRDFQMLNVWEVIGRNRRSIPGVVSVDNRYWFATTSESLKSADIPGFRLRHEVPGRVRVLSRSK